MAKTILVTGGAGFIGSHLCEKLISLRYKVICFDNLSSGKKENLSSLANNPNFSFIKGDVRNKNQVNDIVKITDTIYHLAAVVGVENVIKNPLEDIEVNYEGTKNIIEAAFKQGKKKVIFTSSSEVYGKNNQVPLFEDTSDEIFGQTNISRWIYGHSKALSEHLLFAYGDKGLPYTIIRYFNCFGPRGINNLYANVIPIFINNSLKGLSLPVFGDGTQSRSFCYINDSVHGTVLACEKLNKEIINIGSSREVTINKLAKMVIKLTHSKSKVKYVNPQKIYKVKFEDSARRVPSITKAEKLIGWKAKISLEEGLLNTINWMKQEK